MTLSNVPADTSPMPAAATSVDPRVRAAVRATYATFIASGFGFANWASRIPQVKEHLGLSPASLGLLLLTIAAGSVVSIPTSGPLIARFGSRRTVTANAVLWSVGLAIAGLGFLIGTPVVAVGLFVFGFANGAWDVAMNVQGALVERPWGRAIMPRFHAGWSLGTVAGALLGAGLVVLDVPVTAHLLVVAVLLAVGVPFAVRRFLPDDFGQAAAAPDAAAASRAVDPVAVGPVAVDSGEAGDAAAGPAGPARAESPRHPLAAWREPRTLLVGLFVLAFAFAEGSGNDWISVAVIDDHHAAPALGTLGFAIFLAAMTVGRWFGPSLLDRYGRVPMVRAIAVIGVVGTVLFVFGGPLWVAFVGAVLWGVGASLGFPVGMSAGADDPRYAAGRVSVIASVGYCAFLGGPPLLGFLGDHFTVLKALTAVAVLFGLSALIAASVREPRDVRAAQPARTV